MATVKLHLDKRTQKKDGNYPLKLAINHKTETYFVSLGVFIPKENWIGGKIEGSIQNKNYLNKYLSDRLTQAQNLLLLLKLERKLGSMSPAQLKNAIQNNNCDADEKTAEKILGENYLFKTHAEKYIAMCEADGTKRIYQTTLDKIALFYNLDELTFGQIDYDWLENFDLKLRPTCKTNTRGIHFRNIRAIFRNANKKKLVSKDLYPFDDFSIKREETPHRNLSIDDLAAIKDYPVEPHQEKYRDLFMLMFYLIGINVKDVLHLKEIINGRIEFRRAKTKKLYSIKVQPEAMDIINMYRGKKYLLNFLDSYDNYRNFFSHFNQNLKKIGTSEWTENPTSKSNFKKKKVYKPLYPFLSSYYARHTWATIASDLDIPEKTIRMALGHGTRTTTDIYINFDMRKVDEANRKVIDYLLKSSHSTS